jgi:glycolate oxidase iron-sulfur subunit
MIERKLIDECVHCGFCLPACPTYRSWGNEMDSPRGRIYLMRALSEKQLTLSPTVVKHFDQCLGCMACMTACPSGVKYDALIEETRFEIERSYERPRQERWLRAVLFALLPYPRRLFWLKLCGWLYQRLGLQRLLRASGILRRLPARLANVEALMPEVSWATLTTTVAARTSAQGTRRRTVALLPGCVQGAYFPEVNAATVRVLAAEGCDVVVPRGLGCCGALPLHAGREVQAKQLAQQVIARLEAERVDVVIVNAAGCGSAMKEYARLFAGDPEWSERARAFSAKVKDVSELLIELGPVAPRQPLPVRAAYHDACHLAHAQRVRSQPRALLRDIPELELLEIPDGDECCGSAGVYNLLVPDSAREIGQRKASSIAALAPQLLISANPGCTLQIQNQLRARGIDLPACHPIELLDASINGHQTEATDYRLQATGG